MGQDQDRRHLLDTVNLHAEGFTLDQALRMLHALEDTLAGTPARVVVSMTVDLGEPGRRVRPLEANLPDLEGGDARA